MTSDDTYARHLPIIPNGHYIDPRYMTALVTKLPGEEPHVYGGQYDCYHCGRVLRYRLNGNVVQVTGEGMLFSEKCPYPDGITTKTQLTVPSGQLIVADDLRPVYNGFNDKRFASYNTVYGQHQVIQAYAEQGCAFGPVGNSSPTLYQTGLTTYAIANVGYDEETGSGIVPSGWAGRAWICTDLWAYSIADYEDWKDRCGDDVEHYRERLGHYTVVDVPPGTYQFTHHTGEAGFDGDADGIVVYADIRRLT